MQPQTVARISSFLTEHEKIVEAELVCNTCYQSIADGKAGGPSLSVGRGGALVFPELPEALRGLSPLEGNLCAGRLLFMRIQQRPKGGQVALKGAVINVQVTIPSSTSPTLCVCSVNCTERTFICVLLNFGELMDKTMDLRLFCISILADVRRSICICAIIQKDFRLTFPSPSPTCPVAWVSLRWCRSS